MRDITALQVYAQLNVFDPAQLNVFDTARRATSQQNLKGEHVTLGRAP